MISKQDVQHIAKLARLGITKKEERKFQKDLSSILDYFNSLKEVDVSNTEPTFHPTDSFSMTQDLGTMRKDKTESQSSEVVNKLVEAAPEEKKGHIKVKTIF